MPEQHDAHCLVLKDHHWWRITYMTTTRTDQTYVALSLHRRAKGRRAPMQENDWIFDEFQAQQYATDRRNEL